MQRTGNGVSGNPQSRRGGAALLAVGTIAVTAACVMLAAVMDTPNGPVVAVAKKPRKVEPAEVAVMLQRVGLSPEVMAAAGLESDTAGAVFTAMTFTLTGSMNAIEAADTSLANARQAEAASRKAGPNAGHQEGIAALGDAIRAVTAAKLAQDVQLTNAFEAAIAVLPQPTAAKLRVMRSNREWRVPAAYKVVERTEAQWLALRQALASRRVSQAQGHSVPEAATTLLSSVENDSAVSTALTAASNNTEPVRNVWYSTFGVH